MAFERTGADAPLKVVAFKRCACGADLLVPECEECQACAEKKNGAGVNTQEQPSGEQHV